MLFDIVIPVGPNDINIIAKQLVYTQKNIIGYRKIYIITPYKNLTIDGCIIINEDIFPFSMDTIYKYHGKTSNNGWYLQQLLKLYAGFIIPDILDNYLVIDSDTFFLKPTIFIEDDKLLYNYGTEYHKEYFNHMKCLLPYLVKVAEDKSGICHHMIFNKSIIKDLFKRVEEHYNNINDVNKNFYDIFLMMVNESFRNGSGASEYEIYFNFIQLFYQNNMKIRKLEWINNSSTNINNNNLDYISCHHYMRR